MKELTEENRKMLNKKFGKKICKIKKPEPEDEFDEDDYP